MKKTGISTKSLARTTKTKVSKSIRNGKKKAVVKESSGLKESVRLNLDAHPPILFAYGHNHIEVILSVINTSNKNLWIEADLHLTERISLNPTEAVDKGRVRLGILKPKKEIKKSIKIYANSYTNPNMYPIHVILYTYDKNAVIHKRIDKNIDIRCEIKRNAVV